MSKLDIFETDSEQEKVFKNAYNELNAQDISEIDTAGFIKRCEKLYNMSTEEFRIYFEKNDYEGNVDMQLWYQLTKKE